MPDWNSPAVVASGTVTQVPILHNDSTYMWEIQQITVTYNHLVGGVQVDSPNVGVLKNNIPACSAAPMQPGPGVNFPNSALSQTFAGLPYIYSEVRDEIDVVVTQCTPGATINVFVQYWRYRSDDPAIQQRKATG